MLAAPQREGRRRARPPHPGGAAAHHPHPPPAAVTGRWAHPRAPARRRRPRPARCTSPPCRGGAAGAAPRPCEGRGAREGVRALRRGAARLPRSGGTSSSAAGRAAAAEREREGWPGQASPGQAARMRRRPCAGALAAGAGNPRRAPEAAEGTREGRRRCLSPRASLGPRPVGPGGFRCPGGGLRP